MLIFEEARRTLVSMAKEAPHERVPLAQAVGRVLAADLAAPRDIPPFSHSSMDGFAVHSSAFSGEGPWRIARQGESRAGMTPQQLTRGAAMRIFTGAPLPDGADSVVMQERATFTDTTVTIHEKPVPGKFVRKRGEDIAKGTPALLRGTRIAPTHLALIASLDMATVDVAAKPRVVILATGDEVRPPGTPGKAHSIADSITDALVSVVTRAGGIATVLPSVGDNVEAIVERIRGPLSECDLFVTLGGVSVGDYDFVSAALQKLDVSIDFWKVAIKPGKPLMVARRGGATFLGLPGNPVSALVTFALFGVPYLLALQGAEHPFSPPIRAEITHDYSHEPGRLEFARVVLSRGATGLFVTASQNQASGALVSLANAHGLMEVPLESRGLVAGQHVAVHLLSDLGIG